mmetsp:Transcript_37065/g.71103  ORF Transcript_37065/g.71103 Transcript_37065/m.71103 type:complete len:201 (-) Transcript_37065:2171-2773(-)
MRKRQQRMHAPQRSCAQRKRSMPIVLRSRPSILQTTQASHSRWRWWQAARSCCRLTAASKPSSKCKDPDQACGYPTTGTTQKATPTQCSTPSARCPSITATRSTTTSSTSGPPARRTSACSRRTPLPPATSTTAPATPASSTAGARAPLRATAWARSTPRKTPGSSTSPWWDSPTPRRRPSTSCTWTSWTGPSCPTSSKP